jgi:hypothetical protein
MQKMRVKFPGLGLLRLVLATLGANDVAEDKDVWCSDRVHTIA